MLILHEQCDCDGQGGDLECSQYMEAPWSSSLYLKKWFRTTKAIVLYLSDGTLQVGASPSKGVQLHTYFAWAVVSPTCCHLKHDARGRNWCLPHENKPSFLWFKNKTPKINIHWCLDSSSCYCWGLFIDVLHCFFILKGDWSEDASQALSIA